MCIDGNNSEDLASSYKRSILRAYFAYSADKSNENAEQLIRATGDLADAMTNTATCNILCSDQKISPLICALASVARGEHKNPEALAKAIQPTLYQA